MKHASSNSKSSQPTGALQKGIWYLSRYFKTEKETRKYLKDKEFKKEEIDAAVTKLIQYGYINDIGYAETFVENNKQKYGARLLKQKLKLKGISDEIIANHLDLLEEEDKSDIIQRLIQKFFKSKEFTRENQEKCLRNLMGKGFDFNDIKKELNYANWN